MPMYQLNYLSRPGAAEVVAADDPDEAEDLARRRLLFSEPGFAIAILFEGVELNRITQRPRTPVSRPSPPKRAVQSPRRVSQPRARPPFPEHFS